MEERRTHDRRQSTLRVVYDRRLVNVGSPVGVERRSGEARRVGDRRVGERRLFLVPTPHAPTGTE